VSFFFLRVLFSFLLHPWKRKKTKQRKKNSSHLQRRKLLRARFRTGVPHVDREPHNGRLHDRAPAAGQDRQLRDSARRQQLEQAGVRDVRVADVRHGALVVDPRLELPHRPLGHVNGPLVRDAAQPAPRRRETGDDPDVASRVVDLLLLGKQVVRDACLGAEGGVVAEGRDRVEGLCGEVGVEAMWLPGPRRTRRRALR